MKRRILALGFAVLLLGAALCYAENTQEENDFMDVIDIIAHLAADLPNDRMSPLWDGESIRFAEDELDQEGIHDGRGFNVPYTRTETRLAAMITATRDPLMNEENWVFNEETRFETVGENRFLRLYVAEESYEQLVQAHEARVAEHTALAIIREWLPGVTCEATLLEASDGRTMLGIRAFIPMDGQNRVFEYGGIGLYPDIETEALNTLLKMLP